MLLSLLKSCQNCLLEGAINTEAEVTALVDSKYKADREVRINPKFHLKMLERVLKVFSSPGAWLPTSTVQDSGKKGPQRNH